MDNEYVTAILVSILGGGGFVAVVNYFASRSKNSSDITQSNIETAIKLRNSAMEEYNSVEGKLEKARKLLEEVQVELDNAKRYIDVLISILEKNGINYPKTKYNIKDRRYE